MNNKGSGEGPQAVLSVTKGHDHYAYILEGVDEKPIESKYSGELNESLEVVRRWLAFTIDEKMVDKLGLRGKSSIFDAQNIKIYMSAGASFIYKNLLPEKIATSLKNSKIRYLSLKIDDSLVDIPWELMNDGEDFFCLKYALGRIVCFEKQRDVPLGTKGVFRFLLIADPTGTLPAAENEISYLVAHLLKLPGVKVRRGGMQMRKHDFLNALRDGSFDILHFSGHGDFDAKSPDKSCLIFYDFDNPCRAYEITKSLEGRVPAVTFNNACTSAQTISGLQGLAHAFLSSGSSTYIGALWPVRDDLAGLIGEEFYRYMIYGQRVGEALRRARLNAFKKFGWTTRDWSAFILYGNPALRIFSSGVA